MRGVQQAAGAGQAAGGAAGMGGEARQSQAPFLVWIEGLPATEDSALWVHKFVQPCSATWRDTFLPDK